MFSMVPEQAGSVNFSRAQPAEPPRSLKFFGRSSSTVVGWCRAMSGVSRRGAVGVLALACALGACAGGSLKSGYFTKGWLKVRVAALDAAQWQQVSFADNDLAWVNQKSSHVLAINATCEAHGDPGLDVLTTHLMFGFTERTLRTRGTKMIDGREALLSNYVARLDGVPVEIDVAVLKKNDCVHDFVYVSPAGRAAEHRAQFEQLLAEFTAERT